MIKFNQTIFLIVHMPYLLAFSFDVVQHVQLELKVSVNLVPIRGNARI